LRNTNDANDSSVDEVTKPLYYIVDEVSSDQVKAFNETIIINPDLAKENKANVEDRMAYSLCCHRYFRRRYPLGFFSNQPQRRRRDSETATVTRVGSAATTDETSESPDKTQALVTSKNHAIKRYLSIPKSKSTFQRFRELKLHLPFVCLFKIPEILRPLRDSCVNDESSVSEESQNLSSPLMPLGVSFPHPVFLRRCQSVAVDKKPFISSTVSSPWDEMLESNTLGDDDFTLPPTQTVVETATADSWRSVGSSFCPTDEESKSYVGNAQRSFDSYCDIPFDEVLRDDDKYQLKTPVCSDAKILELSRIADSHPISQYYIDGDEASSEASLYWIDRRDSMSTFDYQNQQASDLCRVLDSTSRLFQGGRFY
jgi:hypothetical protein